MSRYLTRSRIAAFLGGLIAAAIISSQAEGQRLEAYSAPRVQKDTVVTPTTQGQPVVFGFAKQVVDRTGIPLTAPMRSFCTIARRDVVEGTPAVLVDSVTSDSSPELPACEPHETPLVIRPNCELTFGEHMLWAVQKLRMVIMVCGMPTPRAILFPGPAAT